jgi:hypothetical protein
VRLYVFLGRGRESFLTGVRWPEPLNGRPADWIEAGVNGPDDAARGCGPGDLTWWLDEELWEIELGGELRQARNSVLGDRGRLLQRIEAWTPAAADELTAACVERIREHAAEARRSGNRDAAEQLDGYAQDAIAYAREGRGARGAGVAAYVAAHAVAGGDRSAPGYQRRFELERAWQAAWLKARLSL